MMNFLRSPFPYQIFENGSRGLSGIIAISDIVRTNFVYHHSKFFRRRMENFRSRCKALQSVLIM
jgi:hypothetical protein